MIDARESPRSLEQMPAHTSARDIRPLVAAIVAVLFVVAALVFAPPASAHDELIGSDPAADSSIDALPGKLTLTFSAAIATDAGASEVQVTDAEGRVLAEVAPVAQDNTLTQPLSGEASGAVTVLWKVVSSDGHPISGEFTFTVTAAPTPTETAEPTVAPSETAEPTQAPTPTAQPTTLPADEDSSFGDVWPWVVFGLIAVAAGGAVVYLLVSRARREKALAAASSTAPESDSDTPTDR